jgi:hypothetical protein
MKLRLSRQSNNMESTKERIQNILEQLDQTNEDLLALSNDIWLSIDHNDNQA